MDDKQFTDLFTHDTTLAEGDVALVFCHDATLKIAHNIPTVKLTGVIDAKNSGGFVMALACMVAFENVDAFTAHIEGAQRLLARFALPRASEQ